MSRKEQIQPRYAEQFHCIGGDCPDTCCVGWKVFIDRATYQKYQAMPELLPVLEARISRIANAGDADYARINMEPRGCPFLSEERLCSIHKTYGAGYLSKTCADFPRAVRVDRGVNKQTLFLSCPEAARIVLLNPELLPEERSGDTTQPRYQRFLLAENPGSSKRARSLDSLWKLQRFGVLLLKDRSYAMWQRLFILGMFCARLQEISATCKAEQIPELLDNYAHLIGEKRLAGPMENIQPRRQVQLDVTCKFVERALQVNEAPSFHESLSDFRAGVPFRRDLANQSAIAAYELAHHQYYQPFMEAHPFVLENYLTNYILQRGFLALNWEENRPYNLPTEYFVMCTYYMVVRAMLIGISGHYREQFGTAQVVKLVQGFSKLAEHNPVFMNEVVKFIEDSGLNRPGEMATLLA